MARTAYSLNSYTGAATYATIVATGIGVTDTTVTITGIGASWSPLGTAGGWYLALDYGTSAEEKVFVPSGSWTYTHTGVTLSGITRAIDGTGILTNVSGYAHPTGAFVAPVITSLDTSEANFVVGQAMGNGTGNANTSVGLNALPLSSTGTGNTAIGTNALAANTTGGQNVAVGDYALQVNTTGGDNVAIGGAALAQTASGSNHTAVGYNALNLQQGTQSSNTAIGTGALYNNGNSSDSTSRAVANTAVGQTAGYNNIYGQHNTFVGQAAGLNVVGDGIAGHGDDNTFIGTSAGGFTTSGSVGHENTGIGEVAMGSITSGISNTACGQSSLYSLTVGNGNTALGTAAGLTLTAANATVSASGQTLIGTSTGLGSTSQDNYITCLGYEVLCTGPGSVAIGVDHTGLAATASGQDRFVLGTANHTVIIPGHMPAIDMPPSYIAPYKAWTMDPMLNANATLTLITGTAYYTAIWIPQPITLSGISFSPVTFASTDTAYLALFNNTTQLATCSGFKGNSASWCTALISGGTYQVTTPGLYYVGLVVSGSTTFTLQGVANAASNGAVLMNMNGSTTTNSINTLRFASVVIGQRAFYGTGGSVSGTITAPTALYPFFALS